MIKTKNKVESYKQLAELFLKNDTRAFIKDANNVYYFCDLLLIGEDKLRVQCFAPDNKKDLKFDIYWPLITVFNEYKAVGE